MKIALFGGSFDPPHNGHNSVVLEALEKLDIDKLIIMPTYINPFKQSFSADEKQRFLWVKNFGDICQKLKFAILKSGKNALFLA